MGKLRDLLLAGSVIFSVGTAGKMVLAQTIRDALPPTTLEEALRSKQEIESLKTDLPAFRKKLLDLTNLETKLNQDIRDTESKLREEQNGKKRKEMIEAYLDGLETLLVSLRAVLGAKKTMEEAVRLSEQKIRGKEGVKSLPFDYPQRR